MLKTWLQKAVVVTADPRRDLHMAAKFQEELLECQFRNFKGECADGNTSELQELMELKAQLRTEAAAMRSKYMDDEAELNIRTDTLIQEHETQEERTFQLLRQRLEEKTEHGF